MEKMQMQEQKFSDWYSEVEASFKDVDMFSKRQQLGKKRIMGGLFGL